VVGRPSWRIDLDQFQPMAVGSVELRGDLESQCEQLWRAYSPDCARARVLLRVDGRPVGYATASLTTRETLVDEVRRSAVEALSDDSGDASLPGLLATIPAQARRPTGGRGTVTIVVPTRNRTHSLQRLLDSIDEMHYRDFVVMVVDNCPGSDETQRMVRERMRRDERLRYSVEPTRGGSRARNHGLERVASDYVLFADDDTVLDPFALDAMLDGFARSPSVACVTGFVASLQLDTLAKARFDQLAGWGTRFAPRVWSPETSETGPAYPYTAGIFGAGAVYAFRCAALDEIGSFDLALGPGTPAHGAEDLDMFVRTILSQWSIAYEPSMLAWHDNRPTDEEFRRQIWGWGVGLSSYVTKLLTSRSSRADVWRRVPAGIRHTRKLQARDRAARLPAPIVVTQLLAWLYGPIGYARSRFGVRRDGEHAAPGC
jgi:GT2 family glycosyltransferase